MSSQGFYKNTIGQDTAMPAKKNRSAKGLALTGQPKPSLFTNFFPAKPTKVSTTLPDDDYEKRDWFSGCPDGECDYCIHFDPKYDAGTRPKTKSNASSSKSSCSCRRLKYQGQNFVPGASAHGTPVKQAAQKPQYLPAQQQYRPSTQQYYPPAPAQQQSRPKQGGVVPLRHGREPAAGYRQGIKSQYYDGIYSGEGQGAAYQDGYYYYPTRWGSPAITHGG